MENQHGLQLTSEKTKKDQKKVSSELDALLALYSRPKQNNEELCKDCELDPVSLPSDIREKAEKIVSKALDLDQR